MWGNVGVFYSNSCCNVSTKSDSHCWDIRLCKANYHNLSRLGIIYFRIYFIYQLPSTPGQCPNFLVMLWFALPKWGLGQAKREEIGRREYQGSHSLPKLTPVRAGQQNTPCLSCMGWVTRRGSGKLYIRAGPSHFSNTKRSKLPGISTNSQFLEGR